MLSPTIDRIPIDPFPRFPQIHMAGVARFHFDPNTPLPSNPALR
jgi:hypothetical protein